MRTILSVVLALMFISVFCRTTHAAPALSFNINQTCGTTVYTANLTLNTTGSTPTYDFAYSVNGVAGSPSVQTFEYNGTAGFADQVASVCNSADDLGIFVLDTPAPPTGQGVFGTIAAMIGYRNNVTPIILAPNGTMLYGSADIWSEIVRRDSIALMSRNGETLAVKAHGSTFFVFFGNPNEVRYLKLEYYTTALGHTYLTNNKDTVYLYKFTGCEMAKPFTVDAFTPDLLLTVPINESTKVTMKDTVTYPDGYGCKGSGITSFSRELRFTYDEAAKQYTLISNKRIPEIGGVTVVNGGWTTPEGTVLKPLGTYTGPTAANKVYLGNEDGTRFVFVPKGKNSDGMMAVYDGNGILVKKLAPFGTLGKKGMTMTGVVSNGVYYVAVGQKGGGKTKVYSVTDDGVMLRGSLSGGSGTASVTVKYLKLYGNEYGLVTLMRVEGKNVLKVWRYSMAKKAFVQDKAFNLKKLKVSGSSISLK